MELTRQYEQLWDSAAASPDVFAFLKTNNVPDADQLVALLRADQERRWLTDNPLRVEDYLAGLPHLAGDIDRKRQLAIGEFQARRKSDRPLGIQEISSRFPDYSDVLQDLLREYDSEADATVAPGNRAPELTHTEIRPQQGVSSMVSYIGGMAIGVQHKGRYRLDRILGEGAFGRVYLGFDAELQRQVAIKVPTKVRFQKPEDADEYLAEARMVASLDHPHIVPVYDMGRTQDGSIYVVSKFIEGCTLDDRIKDGRSPARESAALMATVALALQHAHQKRLIHRDIKPANILIEDKTGTPYVADFGLAIREEDYLKQTHVAGTPAYMSPEQARGEGHRLDGRSDVFSLGVILYELLTGKKPFRGSSPLETLHQVISVEPRPPRELLEMIPAELERICLKALSKRASDRYASAAEFADDLEQWLKPAAAAGQAKAVAQVIPKGLRSFDAGDADFFLDLLPGARNRDGLPESIAFWKQKIEQPDPEQTFSVGLIYGPSGCGKSSLVRAGLLPHLGKDIMAVYVEATPDDTEARILRGLRKRMPELSELLYLADTLTALRRGHGQRIVIIIDQFEQWLHAHRTEADTELIKALRQCDGGRVQAIVMIRDDFAMAAARFMNALDVPIVQGENFATVDLFDVDHAARVLTKFGQAFGRLPANSERLSEGERTFVRDVAAGLAQDGKVVSVRLSLFAEMVKSKPWTSVTLEQVGGTQGIGVNFLEETFSAAQANPRHRLQAVAARGVLRALLPELGTDIKGHMRSQAELLEATGNQDRPSHFADLLRILDGELRMITPTDPEGHESQSKSDSRSQYYQLTHDYLVPSLRMWLTRKQSETRGGRAELKLAERSALWNAKPENRYLPSLPEWLSIRMLTKSEHWSDSQRSLMKRAGHIHAIRSAITVIGVCALMVVGEAVRRRVDVGRNQAEATRLVEGLMTADTTRVGTSIASLKEFRTWADPPLQQAFSESPADSSAKLHAGLALVADGSAVDFGVLDFLWKRMLTVTPTQFGPVRELLEPHKAVLTPILWQQAIDDRQSAERRFHAACALAAFDPDRPAAERVDSMWRNSDFTAFVAEQLVAVNLAYLSQYQELLRPVSVNLIPPLTEIFKDPARGELAKTMATSLLADYAAQDPVTLTDLILAADATSDKTLFPVLKPHGPTAVKNLEVILDRSLAHDWHDGPLDAAWTDPSLVVRARIESAHGLITERVAFCQDMPLPQFLEVIEALRASGYRPLRVRPHAEREGCHVAAVWTRDSKRWHCETNLAKSDLPASDTPAAKDGLLLSDIAPLPTADSSAEPRFIALWSEPASTGEQHRVCIDIAEPVLTANESELTSQGWTSQCTITVRTDLNGHRLYSAIWSNHGTASTRRISPDRFEHIDQTLWDVAIAFPDDSLAEKEPPAGYAAVWRANVEIESRLLAEVWIDGSLDQIRPLLAAGFRPISISVHAQPLATDHYRSGPEETPVRPADSDEGAAVGLHSATSSAVPEKCSLVFHRPLIPDASKEQLALQQAAAATALLRLNAPDRVWPLLKHSPDPRTRSYLIHRLGPFSVSADTIIQRLNEESDITIRRALILSLGEFDDLQLSQDLRQSLLPGLLEIYRMDPDPGLHAAAEWLLRRWNFGIPAISPPTSQIRYGAFGTAVSPHWSVNTQGQTMIAVPGPIEFTMGSQLAEDGHLSDELPHMRLINRSFAISATSVTKEQFLRFNSEFRHPELHRYPEPTCPIGGVAWNEAVAYCNWLSETEEIPADQWCYEITDGETKLQDGYLNLSGYRLPTEGEIEYVTRAGAVTARYFGETEQLLGKYAWFDTNSQDRTWPVGSLKPNDIGFFDLQGNVYTWCQESYQLYSDSPHAVPDLEDDANIAREVHRVLRGGSFDNKPSTVRSAFRGSDLPASHDLYYGFRVARTLTTVPSTASPPPESQSNHQL